MKVPFKQARIGEASPPKPYTPPRSEESTGIDDAAGESEEMMQVSSWHRILATGGDHPLLAALRHSTWHLPLIQRELSRFADCCENLRELSELDIDVLRRIVVKHDEALGARSIEAMNWPVRDRSLAPTCECGARLAGDVVQWYRIIELEGCDIVKGFAAYLEIDLARYYADDLVYAESLGMHTARRDAGWRMAVRTRPYYAKEDNIWIYSPLDALEEPLGALVIFAYTPPKPDIVGVPRIPFPEHGFDRSEFDCAVYCFEPILMDGAYSPTGFRLTQTGVSRPSQAAGSPSPGQAAAVQCIKDGTGDTLKFISRLKRYLDDAPQLEARMKASPRTELYTRIYRHLDQLWPCVASA